VLAALKTWHLAGTDYLVCGGPCRARGAGIA